MGATLGTIVSSQSCWTCDPAPSDCFTCLSRVDNGDNTDTVTLDFSGCKGSDISWACCVSSSSGGTTDSSCVVANDGCVNAAGTTSDSDNDHKCDTVSTMSVIVPSGADSVLINAHDGQAYNGDPLGDVNTDVCGGNANEGGGCTDLGGTAYCVTTMDLSSCPSSPPPPTCIDGEVCREAEDACDVADYCLDDDCPCDEKYTDGYVFKCAKTAYLCGPSDLVSFECNNGDKAIETVVQLLYPDCIGNGSIELAAKCPNNRGLSNYGIGACTDVGGQPYWTCQEKVDVMEGSTATLTLNTEEGQCLVDFRLVPINRRLGSSGLYW